MLLYLIDIVDGVPLEQPIDEVIAYGVGADGQRWAYCEFTDAVWADGHFRVQWVKTHGIFRLERLMVSA